MNLVHQDAPYKKLRTQSSDNQSPERALALLTADTVCILMHHLGYA